MDQLVECVPNFSEGRNPETVRALVAAIRSVRDVLLIDEEMDQDHHRSVLTFVGPPEAVGEAAFQTAQVAMNLIDLQVHQGGHPRVGATDVVPFVPIRGVRMEECVALAKRVGERIGRELGIPVFLYERASMHPDRANLEAIRRGGLEGLASRMEADVAWAPDFGPPRLHPTAGATVVGARPPLIAYNVDLETADLSVAKAIAKQIRFSSGGLPHVKAIGVELKSRGFVQVSINLTNFEETPIHVAFEAVKREANQRGVNVLGSEVIGLVPRQALLLAAERSLQLEHFDPTQVLETRLEMILTRESGTRSRLPSDQAPSSGPENLATSVASFLEAVADGTPTPGGGSVAALAGALAAALGVMACRIGPPAHSKPRTDAAGSEAKEKAELKTIEQRLVSLSAELRELIQADAEAYAGVVKAYRLPKADPMRAVSISINLQRATEVPLKTAACAAEAASLLREVIPKLKSSVAPDLKVGLSMALAAIHGGLENVKTNLKSITDQEVIRNIGEQVVGIERSLVDLKRLGYTPSPL
jgi:glutamate formiminotransferase/glutamate formiminotransferase/formiminotetrahydrofolate cyclodeaminase